MQSAFCMKAVIVKAINNLFFNDLRVCEIMREIKKPHYFVLVNIACKITISHIAVTITILPLSSPNGNDISQRVMQRFVFSSHFAMDSFN